jgi:hypothetical protein
VAVIEGDARRSAVADVRALVAAYRAEPNVPQATTGRNLLKPIVQSVRDELEVCDSRLASEVAAALAAP